MTEMERFDLLLEQYLDGALAGAVREEFLARLRERPELRKRFCAALAMETALRLPRREASGASAPSRPARILRQRWAPAAAAVVLAGLAGLAWWMAGHHGEAASLARVARVARVETGAPPPLVLRDGDRREPAVEDLAIAAGDRVESGGSAVTVRFDGEATEVVVQPRARATFRSEGGAKRLDIETGAVRADVAPQPKGRPMRVSTPHGTATVVGTRFELAVGATETTLKVERGAVELASRSGAGRLRVKAGQQAGTDGTAAPVLWTAAPPAAPAAPDRWRLDLDAVRVAAAAGWTGALGTEGLIPAPDTEWKGPVKAWLLVTPPPKEPGMVRITPRLRATMSLSLDRPREVALMLLVRPPDNRGIWLANVQANRRLPAGTRQSLALPWSEFRGAEGQPPDTLIGMSVYQAFLMTWGDDTGGLTLHALEIDSAPE